MDILKVKINGEWIDIPALVGPDGTVFTPSVDENGNLSWTNNGGKQNPPTVNIKGPKGDPGEPGTSLNIHICTSEEYDSTTRIPTVQNPDENTFYLVPAEDGSSPDLFVEWIYANNAWEMFGSGTVEVPVTDVQVNGTSILSSGVANIPKATLTSVGVVKPHESYGIGIYNSDGSLRIIKASDSTVKAGTAESQPIVPKSQHLSIFYGLSKVAGVDLANETVTLGTYPATSQTAIKSMLGVQDGLEVVRLI